MDKKVVTPRVTRAGAISTFIQNPNHETTFPEVDISVIVNDI